MKRIVFVGDVGAGKTTLFNALYGNFAPARKTQAVEFNETGCVDTPGEYFSHPRLYHALISTLADCAALIYVHAANNRECRIPAGLLTIYPLLRRIAVISKADAADADIPAARELLSSHHFAEPIFVINSLNADDVRPLKQYLASLDSQ
ncbi:EutP/PduV family microcompartment system protein [Pluralibacter gergoviae]|uniref:EutP/PduV family microcompartment system protein n=1 Tax=Pluralibacter gergoviae TaxID=61647 RepID=A0AAW8HN38_PLUGE|nr:EutP/PduV family microcompartment system protein [Pluralibacter gergoviae]AVR05255.1 ethanolamine utilization protein EutP [Pluralibacter gergoviae]KMK03000.1 ethanolamine utilization protein EutP [Pluralibacter gergoviae]KMK25075.1 ethanolamine utilization protein EutP [Pluralibacter gergoviae]MDQ2308831.1 EutP/PduV family microcompartment system protein [Pluralibacter gergoviae]SUB70272.1 ethanolamine utilization protein EutP [Pluralibacter gergoviae]